MISKIEAVKKHGKGLNMNLPILQVNYRRKYYKTDKDIRDDDDEIFDQIKTSYEKGRK